MKNKLGLVHVYTGKGKGKTSMALGLALRAVGHNLSIYIIQFMKSGDSGEIFAINKHLPNIKLVQFGKNAIADKQLQIHEFGNPHIPKDLGNYKFLSDEEEKEPARRALEHAFNIATARTHDILILDEINYALSKKLISVEEILELIKTKNKNTELILTGRNAPPEIVEIADYVTELNEISHPYQKNIMARQGIDY